MRMADSDLSPDGFASCGATPPGEPSELAFKSALMREQYRSLARLGPYVHGVVILTTVALCGATAQDQLTPERRRSPCGRCSHVSMFRLTRLAQGARRSRARAARRRPARGRTAPAVLGPALAFTLALMAAFSTSQGSVVEFTLALVAVWVAAAACAFCLNALGSAASVAVAAATAPLIVAFLTRGTDLTLWLAALMTVAACFVIRMLGENFRMFAEIVRSRFAIAEKQRAAEDARQAAMAIALTDDLTGLPNRRCFQGQLADRIRTGTKTARPFARRPRRPRRLQAHQRCSRTSGRRRNPQAGRGPARQGAGRARLRRQDGRRRVRHPLRRDRRARPGDRARRRRSRRSSPRHSRSTGLDIALDRRLRLCALSRCPPPSRTNLSAWPTRRFIAPRRSGVAAWPSSTRQRKATRPAAPRSTRACVEWSQIRSSALFFSRSST